MDAELPDRRPSGAGARTSALLVIGAAVCFGTTGTAQALGGTGASAVSLGAARIVFGGALLAIVAVIALVAARSRRPAGAGSHRHWIGPVCLVIVGALGVASYQPTFFTGTSQNGVAVGTLVALGSAPALTGLLEWLVYRRAPGARWAVATAVAAVGVAALSGVFSSVFPGASGGAGIESGSAITPLGLLASLAAGASYAVYALSSKALLDRGWTPTATMGATFGAAAVVMTPVLLTSDTAWLTTPAGALTAAWLAVVATALAYTLFARGLRHLKASRAATLTLIEPLTATVLGVVVLHEAFTVSTVVGLVLLVVGLAILSIAGPRGRTLRANSAVAGEGD